MRNSVRQRWHAYDRWTDRPLDTECLALRISRLRAEGAVGLDRRVCLDIDWSGSSGLEATARLELDWPARTCHLTYTLISPDDTRDVMDLRFPVLTTFPHHGGTRWWFFCPRCQRRCAVLYLPSNGRVFGCQRCHGVRYRSQQMSQDARLWARGARLTRQLGLDPWKVLPRPEHAIEVVRPPGMRRRTFARTVAALMAIQAQ